jgi:endo-1,4-beta-mannosidase
MWSLFAILSLLMVACEGPDHANSSTPTPSLTPSKFPLNLAPPSTPLICPGQQNNGQSDFVSESSSKLIYHGSSITFYGYTSYPGSIGGAKAWKKSSFTQYIDHIMQMGSHLGQNLIRPTDYWDKNDAHPEQASSTIWKNMDYLVCAARSHGIFVEMDLSGFQKVLRSRHLDDFDPNNWTDFLTVAAKHYSNQSSIAFYSVVGEPAIPTKTDDMNKLVAFYRKTTDTLHAVDPYHLITAGGFNHMDEETPDLPWWQQIYSLPNNNIAAFKTYSHNDLQLMYSITAFTQQIGKPAFDEEFGMPQSLGDAAFAGGGGINGIQTSRAQFYESVYSTGVDLGVQGFVFWDLGCGLRSDSYQVSPDTPATWRVIKQHGPQSGKTDLSNTDKSLCS